MKYKYCRKCDAELVKGMPFVDRYDEITGEAIFRVKVRCPNYRWWKPGNHFNEVFEGDEVIENYDY